MKQPNNNSNEALLDAPVTTTVATKKEVKITRLDNSLSIANWSECLSIIKDNVDPQVFNTWFIPLSPKSWNNNKLIIQVPSQWYEEWIDAHYADLLNKTVHRVFGEQTKLFYETIVLDSNPNDKVKIETPAFKHPSAKNEQTLKSAVQSNLNPRYSFENFIVGESNQLAFNAAKAVSSDPDNTRFNPYFIYGASGLGKTHLAQAIGNYFVQNFPGKKCLYISSEQFTMDFVEQANTNDFKKKSTFNNTYRNVDFLIVDDIQFLSGKGGTQDKFFHIFNSLFQDGKKIILTSDRAPKEIKDLDDRLISRFIAGLTLEIRVPDYNHRRKIVETKSITEGIQLTDEIINYIAKNVTKSIREIEGTLIKLIAMVTLDRKTLSMELVQEVVKGLASEPKPISINEIKEKVGMHYNIRPALMESKSRKHEIALARQMAMHFARKFTTLPLKTIGAEFGGRDHSTVLHSCQAIDNYLATDKKVRTECNVIESILLNR